MIDQPTRRQTARPPLGSLVAPVLCGLALFLLPSSHAFVSYITDLGLPQKWNLTNPTSAVHGNVVNRNTRAVRYFLGADAYSSANKTAELNAARACFQQWQLVPGTILRFEEGGLVSGNLDVNASDNTNLIYWAKNSTIVNGGLDNISGTTGVTFSDYFGNGMLAEADIVLNGVQFTWFTDFNNAENQAQYVESVLLHEIGHFIGLAHSPAGGATMFPRGGGGVSVQAGLSSDEIAALYALYPASTVPATVGRITGNVSLGSKPAFGALVSAENSFGNLVAGTVTRTNGYYELLALPPGNYQVRVTPPDPASAGFPLFRGGDVSGTFNAADSNFLPSADSAVTVAAGGASTLNFTLTAGAPPFRIGRLLPPTDNPQQVVVVNYPSLITRNTTDLSVGVYTTETVDAGVTLQITGDGLTVGPATVKLDAFPGLNPPLHLIYAPIQVSQNATPGMRSLILRDGPDFAYANGFLEVAPAFPDYNYDGLDDHFQHQHFSGWMTPNAAPTADPDQDGYNNTAEYISGTNPADGGSVLKVESVRFDVTGATVTWASAPGKRYQVFSRPRVDSIRGWQAIGSPINSTGNSTQFHDSTTTANVQFYRIQALP